MGERECKGDWLLGTACGECPKCIKGAKPVVEKLLKEVRQLQEETIKHKKFSDILYSVLYGAFVPNVSGFVRKIKGSSWHGKIVGVYRTKLTEIGFAVESFYEPGAVQIYPANALEPWEPKAKDNRY